MVTHSELCWNPKMSCTGRNSFPGNLAVRPTDSRGPAKWARSIVTTLNHLSSSGLRKQRGLGYILSLDCVHRLLSSRVDGGPSPCPVRPNPVAFYLTALPPTHCPMALVFGLRVKLIETRSFPAQARQHERSRFSVCSTPGL